MMQTKFNIIVQSVRNHGNVSLGLFEIYIRNAKESLELAMSPWPFRSAFGMMAVPVL